MRVHTSISPCVLYSIVIVGTHIVGSAMTDEVHVFTVREKHYRKINFFPNDPSGKTIFRGERKEGEWSGAEGERTTFLGKVCTWLPSPKEVSMTRYTKGQRRGGETKGGGEGGNRER